MIVWCVFNVKIEVGLLVLWDVDCVWFWVVEIYLWMIDFVGFGFGVIGFVVLCMVDLCRLFWEGDDVIV